MKIHKTSIVISSLVMCAFLAGCAPVSAPVDTRQQSSEAEVSSVETTTGSALTEEPEEAHDISVMSYNIAGYSKTDDAHKKAIESGILKLRPDIAVINEGDAGLCSDSAQLTEIYDAVVPTFNGSVTESVVLINKDKFSKLSEETYCLTATPTEYSNVAGSYHYRFMTAVKLEHKATGKQFYVIATHLENNSSNPDAFKRRDSARKLQAKFLLALIDQKLDASLPFIIAGDLNSSDDTTDQYRKGGISELLASGRVENSSAVAATVKPGGYSHVSGITLDHILLSRGSFAVKMYSVEQSDTPPSDHHPVIAVVELK